MSNGAVYDKLYKLLIVGADNSGTRFDPPLTSPQTIKFLERGGVRYKLQVWDAGKEQDFKTYCWQAQTEGGDKESAVDVCLPVQASTSYYRGAHGVLLLYNATSNLGFQDLHLFIEEIGKYGRDNVKVMLVSHHFQESSDPVIAARRGQELADSHGLQFMQVDCMNGDRVTPLFEKLVDLLSLPPQITPEPDSAPPGLRPSAPTSHGNKRCIIL